MRQHLTRRLFLKTSLLACPGLSLGFAPALGTQKPPSFKLGIITDELTQDLGQALDFISSHSLAYCELRELWGRNIMNVPQADLDRARELIRQHHLQVSDIASPLFKYNLPERPAHPSEKRDTFLANFTDQDTEGLLQKSFQLTQFFGTDKVRIFSYWRVDKPAEVYPHVRARLAKAAALAASHKIILILENEPACNVGTGKELGRIVRDIDSPSLRAMWDPANAVVLGEVPYPNGYREVRGLFPHMHIKDAKKDPKTGEIHWMPVGAGTIDCRGQLSALRKDGYRGTISLETHYRRPDGNTVESTRESLDGLLKIVREVG